MLTQQERQQYEEQGYLKWNGLIQGEKLKHYKGVFDELVAAAAEKAPDEHWTFELDAAGEVRQPKMLHKVQGVCVVAPRVLDLAGEPEIVGRVQDLIGEKLDIFGTKFFPLLPGGGTSTKWHQDTFYFDTDSPQIVTSGIYLEDTDTENGCLRIVPGTHRSGPFEHKRHQDTHGSWVDVDDADAVDLIVPGGTVILFDANLLHGARPNRSNRTRYSTAWHYIPGDMHLEQFPKGVYEDRHEIVA